LTAHDILLVTELSRLGRRLMAIMQLLSHLLEKHVTVICIKEGLEVGDTLNATVLAFAFGLAVEIERSLIAARTREALAQRRQAGHHIGRPRGSFSKQTKLTGRDEEIQLLLQKRGAVSAIARIMGVHRTTMASDITSRGLRGR
jgi:DNA invertase Pin-like site-specific DNA recombinase